MRALVQRVTEAQVFVDGKVVGEGGEGLLILICAMQCDDADTATKLAKKIAKLRIFRDEEGRMNRSVIDIGGDAVVVSQFTLAADTRSGNRPGFSSAASPMLATTLVELFTQTLETLGIRTGRGEFGANMQVSLTNDGPVTIWLDTED